MTAKKTKHQQILEYVRQAILGGTYQAGDRLPTDGQLMRQFSTSRPTVARAMRDLEMEGYLERRAGSGSFVRVPAQTKPSLIGILTPEVGEHELFQPICSEIALQCQKHNLSLLWADSAGNGDGAIDHERNAYDLCQRYISLGVAGVFFTPVEFSEKMLVANREIAEQLDANGISVVLLDRDIERLPKRSRFDLVGIDNFRAGCTQADHMLNLGCKRIGYVSREVSAPTIDLRIAGFRHAMSMRGIDAKNTLEFCGDLEDSAFINSIVEQSPEAIICANDTTAMMLMRSLLQLGIKIPDDIRMIGIDDVKIASMAMVPLTSIHQPCRAIGSAAVNTMVRRIENRKMCAHDIHVDVELVVRDSCGAAKSG
ncbi:GntR family transcriptional regulator [Mariniblastus fucicola]|uniref:Arabinose metabolism transcriptional repressor n=1 Tax=Mariniblastus fucicola TaxID=980251 RepID=A0A5B9PAF5_9BACT|nr:GntR family transcriptional regulator [Mariniblastus fucicola]QEG23757.1 Arabinose metabolism transcriptional repressor [Mariniblastus fucicola]